ncbi:MAG: hypothetical protein ACTSU2_00970 [Promethearchaeota archaeon]
MPECPSCGNKNMIKLVEGIYQCPNCKKIISLKGKEKAEKEELAFKSGEFFMKNTAINRHYEICEKGLIIDKNSKYMLSALICHSTGLSKSKYIRLSWFKGVSNLHVGMYKITDAAEANNIINALEKIDKDYDENFNRLDIQGQNGEINTEKNEEEHYNSNLSLLSELNLPEFKGYCPNCKAKMHKSKNHKYYTCDMCGQVVVIFNGNPIYDVPTDKLPLTYSTNFPVNYYIPTWGITVKWLMGEWKALVIIYQKDEPEKKWLRFYWWTRNLQSYILSELRAPVSSEKSPFAWHAKKGCGSTNIFDKSLIPKVIDAIKKIKEELNWT